MKTLDEYTVVVAPNDETTWWAYVPAIPGCQALGDTAEEARRELTLVFEGFVEIYEEDGRPLPADIRELIPVAS